MALQYEYPLNNDSNLESDLHEHFTFNVEKGQQPLRIDKYLMNLLKMLRAVKFRQLQKTVVF